MMKAQTTAPPTSASTDKSWISKTAGVAGGQACVRNTRITVWGLVESRRLGISEAEILERIEGLTAADLSAAREYAERHTEEIDNAIRLNQDA